MELADVSLPTPPGTPVSVIGFPLGLKPLAYFAVWKTGHIASDISLSNRFLIDATTHKGMSGSPVVSRRWVYLPTPVTRGLPAMPPYRREPQPPTVFIKSTLVTK